MIRAVAYRIQELAHGGLSRGTLRRLASVARQLEATGELTATITPAPLRPGAKLLREWRGRTHTVTAVESGYEYAGSVYPSLSKVAETITGAHWSGPRFFGIAVRSARPDRGPASAADEPGAAAGQDEVGVATHG